MDWPRAIEEARGRITPHILNTPLLRCPALSQRSGARVWLKLESEQHTGSFKARGALNKVLSHGAEDKARGLVTASTGNHARGFARALAISGDTGTIVLPENADPAKVAALRRFDVELSFHGKGCLEAELYAKAQAEEGGRLWVSPYNDPAVIAGQGTIGCELTESLEKIGALFACIGGGGMMGGIASWLRRESPETTIIGGLPERSPEMALSVEAGEVVVLDEGQDTLSDGSAGGLEKGSITFDLCRDLVSDFVLVSEEEIAEAIRFMVDEHHKIIEGAAGVAIASFLKTGERFAGQDVVIIICGANIATDKLKKVLACG